jgi:hypothetical protein
MESGSCSRVSWADEVEADEASLGVATPSSFNLPPLAAAAHTTMVLHSSSLDPDAEPFVGSPGRSGGKLSFSDSEASFDSEASAASGRGKAPQRPRKQRRRRRHRPRRDNRVVEGARRPPSAPPEQPRRLASIVVHPLRMSLAPDAEGFRAVESRRRWRRAPVPRRPVPANLVGKCFNCLSMNHVKADCTSPARCFNCLDSGHQARDCPLPARTATGEGKRGRSPTRPVRRAGRARRRRSSPPRGSPADTASARSASTGR